MIHWVRAKRGGVRWAFFAEHDAFVRAWRRVRSAMPGRLVAMSAGVVLMRTDLILAGADLCRLPVARSQHSADLRRHILGFVLSALPFRLGCAAIVLPGGTR